MDLYLVAPLRVDDAAERHFLSRPVDGAVGEETDRGAFLDNVVGLSQGKSQRQTGKKRIIGRREKIAQIAPRCLSSHCKFPFGISGQRALLHVFPVLLAENAELGRFERLAADGIHGPQAAGVALRCQAHGEETRNIGRFARHGFPFNEQFQTVDSRFGEAHQHTVLDKRPCRFGCKCLVVSLHHAPRDAPQRFLVARSQTLVVGFGVEPHQTQRHVLGIPHPDGQRIVLPWQETLALERKRRLRVFLLLHPVAQPFRPWHFAVERQSLAGQCHHHAVGGVARVAFAVGVRHQFDIRLHVQWHIAVVRRHLPQRFRHRQAVGCQAHGVERREQGRLAQVFGVIKAKQFRRHCPALLLRERRIL